MMTCLTRSYFIKQLLVLSLGLYTPFFYGDDIAVAGEVLKQSDGVGSALRPS